VCCSGSEPHRYRMTHVRFGSLADIPTSPRHVRFTSNNGSWAAHPSQHRLLGGKHHEFVVRRPFHGSWCEHHYGRAYLRCGSSLEVVASSATGRSCTSRQTLLRNANKREPLRPTASPQATPHCKGSDNWRHHRSTGFSSEDSMVIGFDSAGVALGADFLRLISLMPPP